MRQPLLLAGLIACAAALAAPMAPAAAQQRATATRDWSRTITQGANGAFILGNPAAPNKLVEYFSYTCPHCAHFEVEGGPQLRAEWIRRGLVSLEYRNAARDPFDLTAAVLARCGGVARFKGNHEKLMANQDGWMKRAQSFAETQRNAPPPANHAEQFGRIATGTGFFTLLGGAGGLSTQAQNRCLADQAALNTILALTEGARAIKEFTGTPFFVLNGKPLEGIHSWAALQPLLPALPPSGK